MSNFDFSDAWVALLNSETEEERKPIYASFPDGCDFADEVISRASAEESWHGDGFKGFSRTAHYLVKKVLAPRGSAECILKLLLQLGGNKSYLAHTAILGSMQRHMGPAVAEQLILNARFALEVGLESMGRHGAYVKVLGRYGGELELPLLREFLRRVSNLRALRAACETAIREIEERQGG